MTPKPFHPPSNPGGVPYLNVSPDARYLAVGHARHAPGANNPPRTPLRVINTVNNRPVVTIDWHVGRTAFTADQSRVLVVDDADKFLWFTLPDGKPSGEWDFARTPDGRNARLLGLSAKGDAILHYGRPPGKEEAPHLLSGKDGSVLCAFPAGIYSDAAGWLSEDGRHVMLIRNDGGAEHSAEIIDATGKRLGAVKLPQGGAAAVAVSWRAGIAVTYDRATHQLTAYELPAAP